MALQTSGPIKLSEIQAEFGGTNPISISEYYRGLEVPEAPQNQSVPTSGTISMSDFYGTVDQSFVLSRSATSIFEGQSVTITLTTVGIANDTQVPYTISGTGITAGDISVPLTGIFTVQSGTATLIITAEHDGVIENTETFTLSLDNGADSISVSILAPTFSLLRSASTINEGQSITITLNTQGIPNNTQIPYTVTGIDSDDLSSGSLTGNFTIVSGTATQSFTMANDFKTEGTETATLTLSSPGSGSRSWTIIDTSVPTFALSRSAASIFEGQSVTITLSTQGIANGTTVPYTIFGTDITDSDISPSSLTGNFTVQDGTATTTITALHDSVNENTETFTLRLDNLAASTTVSILAPTLSLSTSASSINENQSVTITLTANGLPNGTKVPYKIRGIDMDNFLNEDNEDLILNPNDFGSTTNDEFGRTVAMNSTRLTVASPGEQYSGITQGGKAYIFDDSGVTLERSIANPDAADGTYFTSNIAMSSSYLLVGMSKNFNNFNNAPSVYVYNLSNGNLVREEVDPNSNETTFFGEGLTITDTQYAVGAPGAFTLGQPRSGKVHVYNTTTSGRTTIDNPQTIAPQDDFFGNDLASNSTYFAATSRGTGRCYIYDWSTKSLFRTIIFATSFTGQMKVAMDDTYIAISSITNQTLKVYNISTGTLLYTKTNPNINTNSSVDFFGDSVHIDSKFVYVGAPREDGVNFSAPDGLVHVYSKVTGDYLGYIRSTITKIGHSIASNNTYLAIGVETALATDPGYAVVHDISNLYDFDGEFTVNNSTGSVTFTVPSIRTTDTLTLSVSHPRPPLSTLTSSINVTVNNV